ncbi:MAG: DNA repair protein RecN [Pseudomonadota bacterium]|nr:DNA repair protein RecN [Pseudomonadota bacterium]
MLRSLAIRDIVVFDALDLTLDSGLCALTGETGAGKSILLDALGLAIGQRAEGRLVRNGADRGGVTAMFEVPADHPVLALLDDNDIPKSDDILLRRVIGADGRSRAYVNDQPVSVGLLSEIGSRLVEVHGQAAEVGLLNPATHRQILDSFGGHAMLVDSVRRAWKSWREAADSLRGIEQRLERARQEESFLRHVVGELEELAPLPGEAEELSERRGFLMQVEKIADAIRDAVAALEQDGGVAGRLRSAERALDRIRDRAGPRVEPALEALASAAVEIDEAVNAIHALGADVDVEPNELERVDERLFALRAMARKHQVDPDALPALLETRRSELTAIERGDSDVAGLRATVNELGDAFRIAATRLSEARTASAARLDEAVRGELEPLRMGGARFFTRVETLPADQCGPDGQDRVAFEVQTNPGSAPGPIGKIASGGELSRFMLALKVVLAATGDAPVMIFDEVDRGVGGATADAVGERLKRLSERFQVLVVTHSPQVAARADHQWRIAKETGAAATTRVVQLDPGERREEIARMLSGAEITAEARAAADRLLAETVQ